MNPLIRLTWLGHSCFVAEYDGYSVVLDPFSDGTVPGLSPIRITADAVLCSHQHRDHNGTETIAVRSSEKECPFTIEKIETFHDAIQGKQRGKNTIHILSAGGLRIAHLGDLGCTLPDEQLSRLEHLDALLLPVGGFYTIDAEQANALVEILSPSVAIPMHYQTATYGLEAIGTLDLFLKDRPDAVFYSGHSIEISRGMKKQTAVLTYQP